MREWAWKGIAEGQIHPTEECRTFTEHCRQSYNLVNGRAVSAYLLITPAVANADRRKALLFSLLSKRPIILYLIVLILTTYLGIFSSFTIVGDPNSFFSFLGFRTPGNFCMPTSKRCRFSGDLKAEVKSACRIPNRTSSNMVSGT